jgi:hypothetical protein
MPLYTPYARKTIYSTSPQASAVMGRRRLLPEEYWGFQGMQLPPEPESTPPTKGITPTGPPLPVDFSTSPPAVVPPKVMETIYAPGASGQGQANPGMPAAVTSAETNPSPTEGLDVMGMSQGKGTFAEAVQNGLAVFGPALFGPFELMGKVGLMKGFQAIKGLIRGGKGENDQGFPPEQGFGGVGVPSGGGFPGPEGFGGVAVPSAPVSALADIGIPGAGGIGAPGAGGGFAAGEASGGATST